MNCKATQHRLSAYVDRELSHDEQAAVRAHLHDCLECRNEERELRQLKSLLGESRTPEPPADFAARLAVAIREEAKAKPARAMGWAWTPVLLYAGVAAAAALVTLSLISQAGTQGGVDHSRQVNLAFESQRDQTLSVSADPMMGAPVFSAAYAR